MAEPSFQLGGALWVFGAVLALVPLALWLLKRSALLPGAGLAHGGRIVGVLALAPNQRVVTVEVGSGDDRRWLVLGVTPAGIRTLHTLPPQADAAAPAAAAGFAQLLASAVGRSPGRRDGQ